MVHKDIYQTVILKGSWVRFVPEGIYDVVYQRCPGEQQIAIAYIKLGGRWNDAEMQPQDYARRLYQNSYYGLWEKPWLYNNGDSPLFDHSFKKLVDGPRYIENGKAFELVSESFLNHGFCGNTSVPVKIMDVFFTEQKSHILCAFCTRFVVIRYMSTEGHFESGLQDMYTLVKQFQWIQEQKMPPPR